MFKIIGRDCFFNHSVDCCSGDPFIGDYRKKAEDGSVLIFDAFAAAIEPRTGTADVVRTIDELNRAIMRKDPRMNAGHVRYECFVVTQPPETQ